MGRDSLLVLGLISALTVAAGCGGDDDGGGGGDVELDELSPIVASYQCDALFRCCDSAELEEELGFFDAETEEECTMVYAAFIEGFLVESLQASVDSGRLVYHADRMGACIDHLNGLSCEERAMSVSDSGFAAAGCQDPFEGQVANGDACASDEECQSDWCDGDSMDFEGNVTEGVCGDPPGQGDACPDFECTGDTYCELADNGGTCHAKLSEGSDCFSDDECASDNCVDDNPDDDMPGTCSGEYQCDGM